MEEWQTIKWANRYEVSTEGNIRNKEGKILKGNIGNAGYKQVCLYVGDNGKRKYPLVHRLVAQCFIKNTYDKPTVNHIDGNKTNNRLSNLEWSTKSENQIHAYATGLQKIKCGNEWYSSKLNDDCVRYILFRLSEGHRVKDIASDYEVHQVTITDIKMGRTWKHIQR